MEIIVCALPFEAKVIKEQFKDSFVVYICKPKAVDLGFLKDLSEDDHITNIGICAGKNPGEMYLCNKLIGQRDYYPDILDDCDIAQIAVKTIDYIASKDEVLSSPNLIFDQEAAIIFKEAIKYISPHQISFLKIVSDCGDPNLNQIKKQIPELINSHAHKIKDFISKNQSIIQKASQKSQLEKLDYYSNLLNCNVNMRNRLNQLMIYCNTINQDIDKIMSSLDLSTIKSKNDAKNLLDNIENSLTKI